MIQGKSCTLTVAKDGEYYPLPYSEETVRQASKGPHSVFKPRCAAYLKTLQKNTRLAKFHYFKLKKKKTAEKEEKTAAFNK